MDQTGQVCPLFIDDSQMPGESFNAKGMHKSGIITGYPSNLANKVISGDFQVL